MAFRTTTNRLDSEAYTSAEVQQSTSILPLQYESLIALVDLARRASRDPLSICLALFAHAAFSEVQFVNLMESKIQIQTNSVAERGDPADTLETLQCFSNVLNRQLEKEDKRLYPVYAERGIIQDRRYEEGEADLKAGLQIRKALGNYVPRSGEANMSYSLLAQGKLEECNSLRGSLALALTENI
ncbi:hypothetical protein S7711_11449 [Stachybotrys chartarum IBT 7711]|uniref:Uncharacterized protein n=1 Tax=Stachybotrys chartarum (strain CBS 109288 / IBT 7711) TaxID=1280523 RepID=A0A084AN27_STACB|nr:hypothetical protein S7711_11449 [Stachybotrys chartarum IBT 7711]